ncbi:MAG TPA: type I 3-dehydroquinate dehydratase [Candidatus Saccharicenans sp.]|nr:type I 3-dehydroquinate dehydratase [Candidatus Saccharicenans sp.]
MICVSLEVSNVSDVLKKLENLILAELRLDKASLGQAEIKQLFSLPVNLIATCRPGFCWEEDREENLLQAIRCGAKYVDVEIESPAAFKQDIINLAREKGCLVILSYHNYQETPPAIELNRMVRKCFCEGADIAKIACQVNSSQDIIALLSLYGLDEAAAGKIISLGMGEKGKITRVAGPLLGAPFTYASFEQGSETAEGQLDRKSLGTILNYFEGEIREK